MLLRLILVLPGRGLFLVANSRLEDMEEIYPCTPLQEGMMAETLLDPTANVEQFLGSDFDFGSCEN